MRAPITNTAAACRRLVRIVAARSAAAFRLGPIHLAGDALILASDAVEKVDVVDEVVEARGGHEEREHVGRLVHVRGSHARFEDGDCTRVFRLQAVEARRPCCEQLGEAVEPRSSRRELGVERVGARLSRLDGRLRVLQLRGDLRQLGGQHALLILRRVDTCLQRGDARIDGRLLPDVVGCGWGGDDEGEPRECQEPASHGSR